MSTAKGLATTLQAIFEGSSHELKNHVRVEVLPRRKDLVYHIEPGSGLKINIEIGPAFFAHPDKVKERIGRIVTNACILKRGHALHTAVHLVEGEGA